MSQKRNQDLQGMIEALASRASTLAKYLKAAKVALANKGVMLLSL